MNPPRPLQILARLRRAELAESRRALADAAGRAAACSAEMTEMWRSLTTATPETENPGRLGLRTCAIDGARWRSRYLTREITGLEAERARLAERSSEQLLACKQLEIVLEEQRRRQRREELRRDQIASDEQANQTMASDAGEATSSKVQVEDPTPVVVQSSSTAVG